MVVPPSVRRAIGRHKEGGKKRKEGGKVKRRIRGKGRDDEERKVSLD
jgi:hypothetical protein